MPSSIYQYSSMAPRHWEQNSVFDDLSFVFKSFLRIVIQEKEEEKEKKLLKKMKKAQYIPGREYSAT